MQYCLATMYFMDPADICSHQRKGSKADVLVFQEGANYMDTDNLVFMPKTWEDAQNETLWVNQKYFLGMGHHITPFEVSSYFFYKCIL